MLKVAKQRLCHIIADNATHPHVSHILCLILLYILLSSITFCSVIPLDMTLVMRHILQSYSDQLYGGYLISVLKYQVKNTCLECKYLCLFLKWKFRPHPRKVGSAMRGASSCGYPPEDGQTEWALYQGTSHKKDDQRTWVFFLTCHNLHMR